MCFNHIFSISLYTDLSRHTFTIRLSGLSHPLISLRYIDCYSLHDSVHLSPTPLPLSP